MTSNLEQRTRSQESNLSEISLSVGGRSLPLGMYKWIILLSTFFINVIVPSILPCLGVLLYFELQDPRVSLRQAIWTPIFFVVSWCLADSWGQTAAITEGFQKVAVAASFIAGCSVAATSLIHDSYGSLTSLFLMGMIAGAGSRLLMTISENIFSAHFTNSKPALMVIFLANQSISSILPPIVIAYVAKMDGIHHALLILGALILQTLPTAFLLKKPKPHHTSNHLYLTTQPAYALLHNDIDDDEDDVKEETDIAPNQPDYCDFPQRNYEYKMNVDNTQVSEQRTETDNTPIPLFTNVDLVAGTYLGDVAFSFEDTQRNESRMNEDVDIFVRGVTGHQITKQRPWSCCFRCFKSKSFQKEFHPLAHPAFYLGLISMLAQKVVVLAVWVLLPALLSTLPHFSIRGYEFSVPQKVGVAIVSMLTGLAAIPVMFFIPSLLHPSSYAGRRIIHGIATVVAALGVYAIGRSLYTLHIGALLFFGLSNAASASTLEPLFKEALLGSDHFLGYKSRERDWGKIRGLANTITGLLILTVSLATDIVITDWNHIDLPLVFYFIATFQAFAGWIWIIVPSAYCH